MNWIGVVLCLGFFMLAAGCSSSGSSGSSEYDTGGYEESVVEESVVEESVAVEQSTYNNPNISLAEYNQITTGMTYYDIQMIVGGPGRIAAENETGILVEYDAENGGYGGANFTIENGVLQNKAQGGLEQVSVFGDGGKAVNFTLAAFFIKSNRCRSFLKKR